MWRHEALVRFHRIGRQAGWHQRAHSQVLHVIAVTATVYTVRQHTCPTAFLVRFLSLLPFLSLSILTLFLSFFHSFNHIHVLHPGTVVARVVCKVVVV